jgi:hypothetical protein
MPQKRKKMELTAMDMRRNDYSLGYAVLYLPVKEQREVSSASGGWSSNKPWE